MSLGFLFQWLNLSHFLFWDAAYHGCTTNRERGRIPADRGDYSVLSKSHTRLIRLVWNAAFHGLLLLNGQCNFDTSWTASKGNQTPHLIRWLLFPPRIPLLRLRLLLLPLLSSILLPRVLLQRLVCQSLLSVQPTPTTPI